MAPTTLSVESSTVGPTAGRSHDITLESVGGADRRGFMQARKRGGLRNWQVKDGQTISPRVMSMGELTQAEFPPYIELTWYQDDWSEGIGGILHRNDPHKLASGTRKIDTSIDGKLRMARDLRATTVDTVPTNSVYVASGFAIVEPGTAGQPVIWSFNGRSVYSHTRGSSAWVKGTDPQAQDVIYKNGLQFDIKTYAPCWDRTRQWNLFPYIYKSHSDANWVVSTLGQGRFKFFAKTRNANGDQVLWGGFNIYDSTVTLNAAMTDTTGTTATVTPDPTALIANNDIIIIDTEKMLVTARTATTLTVVRGYDGSTAATHLNAAVIYIYAPHVIRSSTDPTNAGSWSSAVAIGVDDQPITALVADGDTLLVCKTNGVWAYYTDGSTENLTPDLEQQQHSDNFIGAYNWNGHVLLPLGAGGMLDLSGASYKDVSLRNYLPKEVNLHGRIVAIHGNAQYLFILVQDTADDSVVTAPTLLDGSGMGSQKTATFGTTVSGLRYHLLMGTFDEDFRWHHLATLPFTTGTTLNHSALMVQSDNTSSLIATADAYNRVWIGLRSSGATTDAERLPVFLPFGKVGADFQDGFSNDSDVMAITVKYDANLPRVDKQFADLELETESLATSRTVEVLYRLDNNTAWTSLGILDGIFSVAAFQTMSFSPGTTGKVLELQFLFSRTGSVSSANSLGVLSFKLTAQLRPAAVKTIPLTVYLADQQLLLNGATGGSPKGDLAQLRAWNTQAAAVILRTPGEYGGARNCVFLPSTLVEKEVAHEAGRRPELEVSFTLAEV